MSRVPGSQRVRRNGVLREMVVVARSGESAGKENQPYDAIFSSELPRLRV